VIVSAGIDSLLEARVDGKVAAAGHLAGKPAPDTFLAAARTLGSIRWTRAVFEDALSGVDAGRQATLASWSASIARGQAAELTRHGADIVVSDLAELLERP